MRNWLKTEDGWAVVSGLLIVALGLFPLAGVLFRLAGVDVLGWVVSSNIWTDASKMIDPAAKTWANLPRWRSLVFTYVFLLVLLGIGAVIAKINVRRFSAGFTALFWLAYGCWLLGNNAYIAATPEERAGLGIGWSIGLTKEAGYLVALAAGLLIGNFLPGLAAWFRDSNRSELFIKTAIVIYGAGIGLKAAERFNDARGVLFRGLAAIIEAYLIYWPIVYLLARKVFGYSREWAAPLASGISICGVSAAITTGAAIRARPIVPIMVSSLVVVFSVIELVVLPFAANTFLADQPMVAAAWMGLSVKTDAAAFSSGQITESLVYATAAEHGVVYEKGWMVFTTSTVKVFIDLFIGVWAIVLAVVWAYGVDKKPGQRVPFRDIWERFPKFVFGYVLTFAGIVALGLSLDDKAAKTALKTGIGEADQFRNLFFVLTFFSIGLGANLRRLWAEGLGRLALVYAVSLFGFVIWIGLAISFLFFNGVVPPLAVSGGPR
jgi:uncharacterized membrane protein YadS